MKAVWIGCAAAAVLFWTGCGREVPRNVTEPVPSATVVDNIAVENYFELGVSREYFTEIPKRIIVVGANEAETLMDLGVSDTVIGATPSQDSPNFGIKAYHKAIFHSFPALSRGEINSEKLLSMAPDMIVAQQEFFSKNRLGSTAYWNSKGIYTMVPLNTTAPGKLNAKETIDREMKFIRDMGAIFHKEEQAEKIIKDTENRISYIRTAIADEKRPKVMVLDLISVIASYGRDKIAGDMVAAIGGEIPHTTAAVSNETIMKENPDVVFLVSYGDDEGQLAKIRNNPAFRHLTFIQKNALYPIPLKYVYGPETRTIDAVGYMAERLYPGRFAFPKEYDPNTM